MRKVVATKDDKAQPDHAFRLDLSLVMYCMSRDITAKVRGI